MTHDEMAVAATVHALKTLAPYWDAMARGDKTFEVRRDDRGYQRGDILLCNRMDMERPYYHDTNADGTMRTLRFLVTYVLTGGQFGIEPGYVVMGLRKL